MTPLAVSKSLSAQISSPDIGNDTQLPISRATVSPASAPAPDKTHHHRPLAVLLSLRPLSSPAQHFPVSPTTLLFF